MLLSGLAPLRVGTISEDPVDLLPGTDSEEDAPAPGPGRRRGLLQFLNAYSFPGFGGSVIRDMADGKKVDFFHGNGDMVDDGHFGWGRGGGKKTAASDDGNSDGSNSDDGNSDDGNYSDDGNSDDGNSDDMNNGDDGNSDDGNSDDSNSSSSDDSGDGDGDASGLTYADMLAECAADAKKVTADVQWSGGGGGGGLIKPGLSDEPYDEYVFAGALEVGSGSLPEGAAPPSLEVEAAQTTTTPYLKAPPPPPRFSRFDSGK